MPVAFVFTRLKIHPTYINILALLVSIAAGLVFYYSKNNLTLLYLIPVFAFTRIALNALDGMVARALKVKNQKFGEVLNEFIDRLSDVAFFIGLAFSGLVRFELAASTLIAVLLVSYLGIVGKAAGGSRQYGGLMGKADRMFYLSIVSLLAVLFARVELMNYGLWFILVLALITILQRFLAIRKELYR